MEMNSAILDFLKNKTALINLIVASNNAGFVELQNNLENKENLSNVEKSKNLDIDILDSDEDDFNVHKEVLGSCRFSLNEILTDPDFSNKVYNITAINNSNLDFGYVNFDIKLENSASVEGRVGKLTKEKLNNKNVNLY
jgi:uncharacterized protein YcgI (DUF1989 family)